MNGHDEAELLEHAQQLATALILACRTSEDRLNALMLAVEEQVRDGDVASVSTLVGVLTGVAAELMREESAAKAAAPVVPMNRWERRRRRRAR